MLCENKQLFKAGSTSQPDAITPEALLADLKRRGFIFGVNDGKLTVRPWADLPEEDREKLREAKPYLMPIIQREQEKAEREWEEWWEYADKFDIQSPVSDEDYLSGEAGLEWDIEGVRVTWQPMMIGGPFKGMKTSIALDMAVSEATASAFLGRFAGPKKARKVLFFCGEIHRADALRKVKAICEARGVDFATARERLEIAFQLPNLADEKDREQLSRYFREYKLNTVYFDPLYKSFGMDAAAFATNLYGMGPLLDKASRACTEWDVTPVFVHHGSQQLNPGRPMELSDLLFSGPGAFARQWLLINRQSPFDPSQPGKHSLILSYGGSSFPGGAVSVEIDEGDIKPDFSGRQWQVDVSDYLPHKKISPQLRMSSSSKDPCQLVLDNLPDNGMEIARSALRDVLPDGNKLTTAIRKLEREGSIQLRIDSGVTKTGKVFEKHWLRKIPKSS